MGKTRGRVGRPSETWTPEMRREHGRVTWAAKRRRARVAPSALAHFSRAGVVCEELRPLVALRRTEYQQMVEDLGGVNEVSAMQRATLDSWLHSRICADGLLSRVLQNPCGRERTIQTIMTAENSARAALLALGLERRGKATEVPRLEDLVDVSPPNSGGTASPRSVDGDCPAESNLEGRGLSEGAERPP